MGVPGLYRTIFQKYPQTVQWVENHERVDYFYLDFNPIIYICLLEFDSTNIIEDKLIAEVIQTTKNIVNQVVQPRKLTYIALDGPAPKCKLVLQRARRYKSMYEQYLKQQIRSRYQNGQPETSWSKSNITPGTPFMVKLNMAIKKAMSRGDFSDHPHDDDYRVMFSDSNVPGEGEHKITREIQDTKFQGSDNRLCVYSNDGDLIILGCKFTSKCIKKLLILTNPSFLPQKVVGDHDLRTEYIYFDHHLFRRKLFADLGEKFMATRDQKRILADFIGLSLFAGNDFVKPLNFLKMRYNHSYPLLLSAYTRVLTRYPQRYLVQKHQQNFDHTILTAVLVEFAKQEKFRTRDQQRRIIGKSDDDVTWGPFETWEEEWAEYQHTCYYMPRHPDYASCRRDFHHFNFDKKNWYYQYHVGSDELKLRKRICTSYLKSLIFTLRYYTNCVPPSWRWNYQFSVAPWPSDLVFVLSKLSLDDARLVKFTAPRVQDIYTPLEQLILTIPPQSPVFPKVYRRTVAQLLPHVDFANLELEKVNGEKYIYADPILPSFNENKILKAARNVNLSKTDRIRNRISTDLWIH